MPQVNWTKNLVLAVALFALGTFAYWNEYKRKPEKESEAEKSKKVFALKDTQIQTIRIENGSKSYQWECQDAQAKTCKPGDNSKWRLTSPTQLRADDTNVNSLVSSLNNLVPTETIDLKDETPEKRASLLKEYGLSPDLLKTDSVRRVDVKTSAGETVAYLGVTNPINDCIFTVLETIPSGGQATGKPNDTKVYMVPSYFKTSFEHDLTYWRDKKVMAFAPSEIESFDIKSKANGSISAQKKDGTWTIRSNGAEFDGDSENIEGLLSAASYLTAKTFTTDNKTDAKAKAALKGIPEILTLTFKKSKGADKQEPAPVVLTIYSKIEPQKTPLRKPSPHDHFDQGATAVSGVFAVVSNNDPLYELQSSATKQLDKSVKDLRLSKLITTLDRFGAKKIEFTGKPIGEKPLVLTSKDGKWVADSGEVSSEKIQGTLDRLAGNRIHEFLTGSAIPAGAQDGLTLTLGDDKNPAKKKLLFWKQNGSLYARDLDSPRKEAFLVDSTVTDGLPWDRAYYAPAPKK